MKRNDGNKKHHQKDVVQATNGGLRQVGRVDKNNRTVAVQVRGNSGFYDPALSAAQILQAKVDRALSCKPVKHIDPSTIECPQLEGIDLKRALAKKVLKKHGFKSEFLRAMMHKSRHWPLFENECDAIIKAGKSIEEKSSK